MHGGPTSRLAARTDFAYRLFDAYLEHVGATRSEYVVGPSEHAALDAEVAELEHELTELFGPRPEHRDPAPIEPRTVRNLDDDIARA